MQAGVGAVVKDELDRLPRDALRAHLAGKGAEVDPAFEAPEETFDLIETEMNAVGAVSERVRGDETDIPETRGGTDDLVYRTVAHAPPEEARRLAVAAGERA